MSCVSSDSEELVDYVVKVKSSLDARETGLISELTASLLASKLGLKVPDPALINISSEFAESVSDDQVRKKLRDNIGLNFGSRHLAGGYSVWPTDKPVPSGLTEKAMEIVAFDAMIQNFDRRPSKPNLLSKGDELIILDHEGAFSFLYLIVQHDPWKMEAFQDIVRQHLFFRSLKGKAVELKRFANALSSLNAKSLDEIIGKIPMEWKNSNVKKVTDHLSRIIQFADKFVEGVRGLIL